jgi:hypothetical protein
MALARRYLRTIALYAVPVTLLSALLTKTSELLNVFDSVAVNETATLAFVFFQVFWKEILLLLVVLLLMPAVLWAARRAFSTASTFANAVRMGEPSMIASAAALGILAPLLSALIAFQTLNYVRGKAVVLRDIRNVLATAAVNAMHDHDLAKARRIIDACFVLNRDSIVCNEVNESLARELAILHRAQDIALKLPDYRLIKQCLLLEMIGSPAVSAEAERQYRALVERYQSAERAFRDGVTALQGGDLQSAAARMKESQKFSPSFGYAWQIVQELGSQSASDLRDPLRAPYTSFLLSSEGNAQQLLEFDGIGEVPPMPEGSDANGWMETAIDEACANWAVRG